MNALNTNNKKRNQKHDKHIGKTDPKVDAKARDMLISARVRMLIGNAFFGNLATRLRLVNADKWCSTAATDSVNFYYNSNFVTSLGQGEVQFLVGHEVLHCVYDHMGRVEYRDPQIWNIAADYAVNADLKKHQIGDFITTVPCLFDPKYRDMCAEEIYEDLLENAPKMSLDDLIDKMIDEHMDPNSDDAQGSSGETDGESDGNNGGRPKPMTPQEREMARQEMRQAIISAANTAEAGQVPAAVKRMIDEYTNPTMPWRDLIQTNITSTIRVDYSWMRTSRRGWHVDAIMPGMTPGEEIDVAIAIDMSGSISQKQAQSFLSEVAGLMEAFDGFKLHVFCFDTEVYNPQDFVSENMDTIDGYEPVGGGGTDFECVFTYLRNRGVDTKRLIMFTDGYPCGSWGDDSFCDTTFIIHGTTEIVPPFGQYAYLNDLPR